MTQSTTTLLSLVNQVLLNIGERPVVSLGAPRANVIQKTVNAIKDGLTDLQMMADWTFLRQRIAATTWNLEQAVVPNIQRLYHVEYLPDGAVTQLYQILPQVHLDTFYQSTINPFSTSSNFPNHFAYLNNETFLFNPYPVTTLDRSRILFTVQVELINPTLPTDFFNIPERYIPLFINHVCTLMAVRHLADKEAAAMYRSLVQAMLPVAVSRDSGVVPGKSNAYKGYHGQHQRRW